MKILEKKIWDSSSKKFGSAHAQSPRKSSNIEILHRLLRRPPPRAEVLHPHHRRQARDSLCGETQGPQRYQDGLASIAADTRQAAEVGRPPVLVRPSTRPQRPDWGGHVEYRRETI